MKQKVKKSDQNSALYRVIPQLQDAQECYRFFSNLCTVAELKAMEQRFQIAQMLSEGMIYNDILAKTGASSATISRVNRSIDLTEDFYQELFSRQEQNA